MHSNVRTLRRFLNASSFEGFDQTSPDPARGLFPFATISRQYGAGGRRLARTLIKELEKESSKILRKWGIFDRHLCELMVRDPRLKESIRTLFREEYQSEAEALILSFLGRSTFKPAAYRELFEIVYTSATFGKVIIVGRAGACITRALPQGVHIRLVASDEGRIKRLNLGQQSLSNAEARRILQKNDRDRAQLVKRYFNQDIEDPLLYDSTWNTDCVPFKEIARSTILLIKSRCDQTDV